MTTKIPFLDLGRLNAPYLEPIENAVKNVIESGRYIGGAEVESFEKELAAYQGAKHAVAVSNGLDALRIIMQAWIEMGKLHPGDEVIVPANTYIASILAISHAGLTPVPVEPDKDTLNLDTSLIKSAITPRTRAIMVVHLYGRTCWDKRLREIAIKHNLLIIEDNAQGIGALSMTEGLNGGLMAGSLGNAAAFSFYPTKNLGAMGDAGAIVTDDDALAAAARAIANYGSDRRYHNIYCGFNCRMDPVQAAVLRVKLRGLDADNSRRRELAKQYSDMVNNESVKLCIARPAETCNYHQLVALCERRDELREHLASHGIGTDIHYATPPHMQPCYSATLGKKHYPVTELLAQRVVSLPIAPYLSDNDVARISNALNSFH